MTAPTAKTGAAPRRSAEAADAAEQVAPLDALSADAALGTFRRFALDASAAKFAAALARKPYATDRRLNSLAAELVRIAAGPPSRSRHVTCGNDEGGRRNGAACPGRTAAPASGRLRYKSFEVSDDVLSSVESACLDELDRFTGGVELGG